ncbi:MAG TPA: phosphatase [Elusimicrobia bacterium]|nr:MAG: hypothetical protein A2551_04200 [Elusimicrobia bacterium RIFOXYD2_FULL_34_30]HAM39523.1 phosphatase [Elusimicrobiota bacterium]
MENSYVDLHVHTKYSDGAFTPEEAVRYAKKVGLTAISITDHDTTEGLPEAIKAGSELDIEVIPGVELSVAVQTSIEQEIHILGYFINWEDSFFQKKLKIFQKAREQRANQILEKLKKLGIIVDEKKLSEIVGVGVFGRLHFAKVLVETQVAKNINEVFNKYLGYGKPAYVPKLRLTPDEAIKMIISVGGVPILAHPHCNDITQNTIESLVKQGLKGIEVWHIKHTNSETEKLKKIAEKFEIISTGGSDCHGVMIKGMPAIMGTVKVSYEIVTELKKCRDNIDKVNTQLFA